MKDDDVPEDWPDAYCELPPEPGEHCMNRATQIVAEPFTPAGFTMRVCDECAKSQIDYGFISKGVIQ